MVVHRFSCWNGHTNEFGHSTFWIVLDDAGAAMSKIPQLTSPDPKPIRPLRLLLFTAETFGLK